MYTGQEHNELLAPYKIPMYAATFGMAGMLASRGLSKVADQHLFNGESAAAKWFQKSEYGSKIIAGANKMASGATKSAGGVFWDKFAGTEVFKVSSPEFNSINPKGTRRSNIKYGEMAPPSSTSKAFNAVPFADDVAMWFKRGRAANSFDKSFYGVFGRNVNIGQKMLKRGVAPAFAMWAMNNEVDQYGVSGLATGPVKEVMATVGARLGIAGGSSLGAAMGGTAGTLGRAVSTGIGGLAGGAALGMVGYTIMDTMRQMAKMGRNWSLPETGGNYQDSFFAQSMRQRSMNMIRTSSFNIRSELGNEATHIFRGF